MGGLPGFGAKRGKREVIDVLEMKPQDKSLDKLLNVRKQRLDRLERERKEALEYWRGTRTVVREAKERWRKAVNDTNTFWANARAEFFRMATTSGEFRKAKATYERLKIQASELRLSCNEYVTRAKTARQQFFEARQRVLHANKQQEKLSILRDEIRLMTQQPEM